MRKNKMMRFASALMVVTLLSTSVISGTFAKYTTTANASDSARVAKWGVVVGTSGQLFDTEYTEDDVTDDNIALSVIANDTTSVVAPGTENTTGITFQITGQPEVAVDVNVVVTGENSAEKATDIYLSAGDYADMTTGTSSVTVNGVNTITGDNDYFTVDAPGYNPVVYTLKDGAGYVLVTGNLAAIETYLENLSGRYEANANLTSNLGSNPQKSTDGSYVLTWAWAFGTNNTADTVLGNLAADNNILAKGNASPFEQLTATTDYNLKTTLGVAITVTQVD